MQTIVAGGPQRCSARCRRNESRAVRCAVRACSNEFDNLGHLRATP